MDGLGKLLLGESELIDKIDAGLVRDVHPIAGMRRNF